VGIGPTLIDNVVGIAKGYATRVGLGPFPTELEDATGELLRQRGAEFGSTTGRPRRCGWLDIPALRLAIRLSGIQGLALTKLDVLAGLDKIHLCVAYRLKGRRLDEMPLDPDDLNAVVPEYEELPGWAESPRSEKAHDKASVALPDAAARYIARVSELAGVPVWVTSVGPSRSETIISRNPFLDRPR
jgi:adenylosuccinate synthase